MNKTKTEISGGYVSCVETFSFDIIFLLVSSHFAHYDGCNCIQHKWYRMTSLFFSRISSFNKHLNKLPAACGRSKNQQYHLRIVQLCRFIDILLGERWFHLIEKVT